MLRRGPDTDLVIVGCLPEDVEAEILAQARRSRRLPVDDLASAATAQLLVVGDHLDEADLSVALTSLREVAPALVILLFGNNPRSSNSELFDGAFDCRIDRDSLLLATHNALVGNLTNSNAVQNGSRKRWTTLAASLAVLGSWQLISAFQIFPPYILPSPTDVWLAFVSSPARYLRHALITTGEAAGGFLLANLAAMATAIALHRSRFLRDASLPVLSGLQALPIIALAPLFSVWMGTGFESKIAMAAVVAFFPLLSNLLAAFVAVDKDLLDLFAFHRATYGQTLRRLLLPASHPTIVAALRTSGGLAVVGAIVAEFTGADQGLGFVLLNATYRLETASLFVAILLSAILGVIFASAPKLLNLTAAGRVYNKQSRHGL